MEMVMAVTTKEVAKTFLWVASSRKWWDRNSSERW